MHAKACEASRGHISRFPFDWAIHQGAGKHLPRNSPSGRRYSLSVPQLLRVCPLFRCVQSGVLVLSMPLYRQWLIKPDCYPAIGDRVCQIVLFASGMKHSAHCAQVHNVRSAYVYNALACLKP